jgi:hypothetical protein
MKEACVDVIPTLITLTSTCNDSNISTMSDNEIDSDRSGDDESSTSDVDSKAENAKLRRKLLKMGETEKKRKREMVEMQEQLKDRKQAKEGKVLTKKRITRIKDLDEANILPMDKLISMNNFFRDAVFRSLKLVTKDVLKSGDVVKRIMQHLKFITPHDRSVYRVHIELALQKQIGQYRDNSIKNIKWKYRTKKGTGPGKK